MKKQLGLLTLFMVLLAGFSALNAQSVRGEGPVVSEKISMSDITAIGLGISANVYIKQGSTQSIEIKGQQNIIDLIEKKPKGESWDIKFPRNTKVRTSDNLQIFVTLKSLESLNIGGSGSIIGEGSFTNIDGIKMNIGGSGSIKLALEAAEITCNIGGAGSINLQGSAQELDINIGGSGSVKAADLKVTYAKVNAAGSGSAVVDVSDKLTATIVGSGGVKYKGNPKVNQTVMGSGRVKAL